VPIVMMMMGSSGEIGRTQEMTAVVHYISDWSIIMNGPSGEILNYLSLCTVQFGRVSSVFSCLLLGRSPTFDLQCDKSPNPQAS